MSEAQAQNRVEQKRSRAERAQIHALDRQSSWWARYGTLSSRARRRQNCGRRPCRRAGLEVNTKPAKPLPSP